MEISEVLEKHFREDRTIYYSPADAIFNGHYLSYRYMGSNIVLTVGSDDGEVEIGIFNNAEKLDLAITRLLYSKLGVVEDNKPIIKNCVCYNTSKHKVLGDVINEQVLREWIDKNCAFKGVGYDIDPYSQKANDMIKALMALPIKGDQSC